MGNHKEGFLTQNSKLGYQSTYLFLEMWGARFVDCLKELNKILISAINTAKSTFPENYSNHYVLNRDSAIFSFIYYRTNSNKVIPVFNNKFSPNNTKIDFRPDKYFADLERCNTKIKFFANNLKKG